MHCLSLWGYTLVAYVYKVQTVIHTLSVDVRIHTDSIHI